MSTDDHPFASEECIVVALTTTAHDEGITVPADAWTVGGSETQSYASPWYVTTIKTRTFDRHQGRLESGFVTRVAQAVHDYVPADD